MLHPHRQSLKAGYLLVDFVAHGQLLSSSWEGHRHDRERRATLFRDMSKHMLSLARHRFPRIGSLTMDDSCVVAMANRPLTLQTHELENHGISSGIARDCTYEATDAYLLGQLACHDNRIRYRPNSILSRSDGQSQLSTLAMMRAVVHHFSAPELRRGPFVLMLTDLHQSNIFVDDDWHITSLIDLEWTCSLPAEMLHPPYWLTGRGIDQITGKHLKDFEVLHKEFMSAFEEEEKRRGFDSTCSERMWKGWRSGNFWYFIAVESFTGLNSLFTQHIQPIYVKAAEKEWREFDRVVASYWAPGAAEFIGGKVKEREQYLECVKKAFRQGTESTEGGQNLESMEEAIEGS